MMYKNAAEQCKKSRKCKSEMHRLIVLQELMDWNFLSKGETSAPVHSYRYGLGASCMGLFLRVQVSTTQRRLLDFTKKSTCVDLHCRIPRFIIPVVAMSVSRAISQSRFALSRGFTTRRATGSILHLVSAAAPQRQFSSSARNQEEVVQTPATGPEVPLTATRVAASGNNAHSIAITKLPWNTVPADIEQLLRDAGVDV